MTELWKEKHVLFEHGQGVELTGLCAQAAVGASRFYDFRYQPENGLGVCVFWPQKEMGVGFLHIAVQELDGMRILE
jgi:hypothetical protein